MLFTQFIEQDDSCCSRKHGFISDSHPPLAQQSCFVDIDSRGSLSHRGQGHCVDPVPILAPNHNEANDGSLERAYPRCSTSRSCNHNQRDAEEDTDMMTCIIPDMDTQLLRIGFIPPAWSGTGSVTQKTILWSGPKVEVWEQGKHLFQRLALV